MYKRQAVEIAHDIIAEFGGLVELLQASKTSFCNTRGLGPAKYAQLSAVLEIAKRYQFNKAENGAFLESPDAVKSLVALEMRDLEHEIFACLFLDNRHRLISYEALFRGTIDSASVYPREVVKAALACNAAAVVLAHNHPSGVAEPSRADIDITARLTKALKLIDAVSYTHLTLPTNREV